MTRHEAKQIALDHIGRPSLTLIYCGPDSHGPSHTVAVLPKCLEEPGCGAVFHIDGKAWKVKGWGPTNSHRQRAIVEPVL